MHRLAAVEHAALRAAFELQNPAVWRSRSTSDAYQSLLYHTAKISALDGHPRPSLSPMIHQSPNSPSDVLARARPPLPSETGLKSSLEQHPTSSNVTPAPHPSVPHTPRLFPTFWSMIQSPPLDPRRCPSHYAHLQDHCPSLQKPVHGPELTACVACDTSPQACHSLTCSQEAPARVPPHCPALHSHPQDHNPGLRKPTHRPELTVSVARDTTPQVISSSAATTGSGTNI